MGLSGHYSNIPRWFLDERVHVRGTGGPVQLGSVQLGAAARPGSVQQLGPVQPSSARLGLVQQLGPVQLGSVQQLSSVQQLA